MAYRWSWQRRALFRRPFLVAVAVVGIPIFAVYEGVKAALEVTGDTLRSVWEVW